MCVLNVLLHCLSLHVLLLQLPSLISSCTWQLQRASFHLHSCTVSETTGQRRGRDCAVIVRATYGTAPLILRQIICGCGEQWRNNYWYKQRRQTWAQAVTFLHLAVVRVTLANMSRGLTNMLSSQSPLILICPQPEKFEKLALTGIRSSFQTCALLS